MHLKDYYTILELPPSATPDEIKKAYRKLAHQFHPDKKGSDPYAAARFTEIKEAYETLTNPTKKSLYLQQRWYAQSRGNRNMQTVTTPEVVLQQMLELDRQAMTFDIYRMDKEGFFDYLCEILSDENIQVLNTFKEEEINQSIITLALKNGRLIPYSRTENFAVRLQKIKLVGETSSRQINQFAREMKRRNYWERGSVWIVLLIVILLCLGIFLTANN